MDFGVVKVVHAGVGVADEKLLAGQRQNDGGCPSWEGLYPQVIHERTIFHFLHQGWKRVVKFLGAGPRFQCARDSAIHIVENVVL